MSVQLDVNQFIPTQREDLRKLINAILDDFMEPLVKNTIIEEIKRFAEAANLPQGFADGVKFQKTGTNVGNVINTWGTQQKPLALWFNYGTTQHWVEPKTAKALHWKAQEGTHATAIYFRGESKEGDDLFSMGHYVSGVPRTEVMERGFNLGKKRLLEEAKKIVRSELKANE